ncbi:hypothetical protein SORBI_3005G053001 [Sorghum bicolor]|uniref:Uncharacterized protein n=1 Tax=Sorghum bicolor TaxID=4558 RepID=A0A1Z5RH03_SORBI|nr:hypothetical protein SORBI_3005G053001 [Sorghum bicolor]
MLRAARRRAAIAAPLRDCGGWPKHEMQIDELDQLCPNWNLRAPDPRALGWGGWRPVQRCWRMRLSLGQRDFSVVSPSDVNTVSKQLRGVFCKIYIIETDSRDLLYVPLAS